VNNPEGILITGGAGFVGSTLAIGLKKIYDGARVIALDNLRRRGSELNVERVSRCGVDFVRGDVRRYEDLRALGAVDLIIECSAEASVLAGYKDTPDYLIETNVTGGLNCLRLAREREAGLIFLSTSRVYSIEHLNSIHYREDDSRFNISGEQEIKGVSPRGINEDFSTAGERSLYGSTKLAVELMVEEFTRAYGIRGVVNRCGVIAGPWQMGKIDQGITALWTAAHFYGNRLDYIGYGGSGKQVRDVLNAEDLVKLVAAEIEELENITGEVFNVGGGVENSVSLKELTGLCREVSGREIDIGRLEEDRRSDIRLYITDNSKIKRILGWYPETGVKETVEDIYKWVRDNSDKLKGIFCS